MTYFTIEQIKAANKALGHFWFSPATARFFRSRASGPVIGNMFVSSERKYDPDCNCPRLYTIRMANEDGSIDTVGEFQAYRSKRTALNAIRRIVANGG
jgi:hypothetical protein